jgi:hypothetical protein
MPHDAQAMPLQRLTDGLAIQLPGSGHRRFERQVDEAQPQ